MVELQLGGCEATGTGFGDENLDERRLVAAHGVEVVGDTVDIGDAHVDGEPSHDCPLGFGREAGESVDE